MRRSLIGPILILIACFIGVALLDDPSLYDPQPGPNARILNVEVRP